MGGKSKDDAVVVAAVAAVTAVAATVTSKEDAAGISKDLLDSVSEIAKLPVWKPDSERDSEISSPSIQKTPKSTPGDRGTDRRSSSATTDKTFEDLVKKVDDDDGEGIGRQRSGRLIDFAKHAAAGGPAVTPARSDTRESVSDAAGSEHDFPGVDYDDYDENDEDFRPPSVKTPSGRGGRGAKKGVVVAAATARGRGRPRGATSSARGRGGVRGRPRSKPSKPIDNKNLVKVQKELCGTEFDFADDFDDDKSDAPKVEEFSLKALREKTKMNNQMLDARKQETAVEDVKSVNEFDFENDDEPEAKVRTAVAAPKQPAARGRGRGRGRGVVKPAGRPRGRPPKKEVVVEAPISEPESEPEPEPESEVEEKPEPPPPRHPKQKLVAPVQQKPVPPVQQNRTVPKLKLGQLIQRENSRKDSPKGSPKIERKASMDDDSVPEMPKKVPKIKIKLGAKPELTSELAKDVNPKIAEAEDRLKTEESESAVKTVMQPQAADKAVNNDLASVASEVKAAPAEFSATEEKEEDKKSTSSPSSPLKKGSRIDFLANKLRAASSTGAVPSTATAVTNSPAAAVAKSSSTTTDLDTIFGPPRPLNMSTGVHVTNSGAPSAPVAVAASREDKSELDGIQEEMSRMNKESGFKDPRKKALAAMSSQEDDMGHVKMKFYKQSNSSAYSSNTERQTTTPPEQSVPVSSAAAPMQKNYKKALLNQYYGQDIYPATSSVSNGPTAPAASVTPLEPPPTVRNVIKMPKAVASVTSVPTRADYQQQLEANLERKRKRDKGLEGSEGKDPKANEKGGKKKKGRGKDKEDQEYKPKSSATAETADAEKKKTNAGRPAGGGGGGGGPGRKTRGKPPKKCLAESPEHSIESGDMKAENMKYAEQVRAEYESQLAVGGGGGGKKQQAGGGGGGGGSSGVGRGRGKKRKTKDEPTGESKTPRLVIKFSKDSKSNTPTPLPPPKSNDPAKNNGGITEYDFMDEEPPGGGDVSKAMVDGNVDFDTGKGIRLKIKPLQKAN